METKAVALLVFVVLFVFFLFFFFDLDSFYSSAGYPNYLVKGTTPRLLQTQQMNNIILLFNCRKT